MRLDTSRQKWPTGSLIAFAVAMAIVTPVVMAEDFGPVHYDPKTDQIVVTVIYDGTNPNHHFSFKWGRCRKVRDHLVGPAHKIIDVDIIDEQGNDAARKPYKEIVKVPLAGVSCRPATVTLWTPPNSSVSIGVP
jgi:hypothetical protein